MLYERPVGLDRGIVIRGKKKRTGRLKQPKAAGFNQNVSGETMKKRDRGGDYKGEKELVLKDFV